MKRKQFGVLGLGRFGMSVAKTLSKNGFDVIAVDSDPDNVQEASEFVTYAAMADITDEAALRGLGLANVDVAVVAVGGNLEAGVMSTLICKEMGIPYLVAKAKNDRQKKILDKLGADRVVFPEGEMGVRIANTLSYDGFVDFMELADEFAIAELSPFKDWIGKSLIDLNFRQAYGLNVVGIKSKGVFDVSPDVDRCFEKNDIIVVIGESSQLQNLLEGNSDNDKNY